MKKPCIITIPADESIPMDVQTGDVPYIAIVNYLQALTAQLSKDIVEHARKKVGDDPIAQERYIDEMRKKAGW